jgi:hypothetical protein
MKFKLQHVEVMPKALEPGVLYVSETFNTAAHLCPCGCGAKVRTPLGPTEWRIEDTPPGPSLYPSVGNWQQPCRSHYWITQGRVRWADQWSDDEIAAGRRREEQRRREYCDTMTRQESGMVWRVKGWVKRMLSR